MKRTLPSIPQVYRNVKRWTEILSVLSKYGLADWLSRLNVDFVKDGIRSPDGGSLARESHETRIRLAMNELGPTFVKLAQLLSTRPDLIGTALADELSKLQSHAKADDFGHVRTLVEAELGQPLEDLFREFGEEPIASASIGQVHRAVLTDGRQVVVKVQHAGIERTVETDLDILVGLAQLAERVEEYRSYRPAQVVGELARTMRRELEFGREERNLTQFAAMFEKDSTVRIPQPISAYCTPRVLTMEYVEGIPIDDTVRLQQAGYDCELLARRLAEIYLRMIFHEGFFHADPHPGNLLVTRGESIALLDFGMCGRISERSREDIEEMLLAIISRDVPLLATLIRRLGSVPPDIDDAAFSNDVAEFMGQYAQASLERFSIGAALRDMTGIIRAHRIILPAEVALLIKVLITLEGTGRRLSPNLSVLELMRPFRRTLLLRRFSPARHARKARRIYLQLEQLAEDLPHRFGTILEQIQSGKFDVHLDHRRLGPSVNRLVMGMLTSALFVGSSLMLSNKVPPLLLPGEGWWGIREVSLIGLGGLIISHLIGARVILAIRRSGNLDRE
ncbi:MAG TPA: ABC transporter [Planctomycetaceae bacterium]|nr:ABC transporter [Planctomycetaceae bacterium]HRF00647.1 AarF/UbiB family protein [Pirellulaceae bacterium]